MTIGLVGLPQSGKTTLFNALTHGHAELDGAGGLQPHVGVAKVADPGLYQLAELEHSKRIVPAELEFVDVPTAPEGFGKSRGIGGEFLNVLQRCDALAVVVRAFQNPAVPHPQETIDFYRDMATLELEMAFSDMGMLERREQKIQASMKGARASERDALLKEAELVTSIRGELEADVPVREQRLSQEAMVLVDNFQLLTAKPLLILVNAGEEDLPRMGALEQEVRQRFARPMVEAVALCGKLEVELAQMAPEDEAAFRSSLEAGEPALERVTRLAYSALKWLSFLTASEKEARAWTIVKGATAFQAAAKVHSDIQRGFIRAEVVPLEALAGAGSHAQARRQGLLRSEGKGYVVQEGDVVNFLFNI